MSYSNERDRTETGAFSSDQDGRWQSDRRSGLERRGSGLRQPPSREPRAYGFRSFGERRSIQDRRRLRFDAPADPCVGGRWNDGPVIELTADEIAVLLDRDER